MNGYGYYYRNPYVMGTWPYPYGPYVGQWPSPSLPPSGATMVAPPPPPRPQAQSPQWPPRDPRGRASLDPLTRKFIEAYGGRGPGTWLELVDFLIKSAIEVSAARIPGWTLNDMRQRFDAYLQYPGEGLLPR